MVWFQCEDCGENLKKPKLPNHFWICSASKLSCIDCGETFGQESVQGHTQCITEAEKYGPKGQAKFSNGATAKPKKDSKQKPEVDINVGLSQRPPWFCSLCNTKATSKQTLLLHADGKKHRAKARAIHKQQSQQNEVSSPDTKVPTENTPEGKLPDNKAVEEPKTQDLPKNIDIVHNNSEPSENGTLPSKKKRKHDASKNQSDEKKTGSDDGEVIQVESAEPEKTGSKVKKAKHNVLKEDEAVESGSTKEDSGKKIKWKKLVASALKSNPDGILKMRKLQKLVLKALHESGASEAEAQLSDILERKIHSSARFSVDKKYVRLVAKD